MISVVILESRSPGSVVITRGHPEFSSGSTDWAVCCTPFDVLFLKCSYIKFAVNSIRGWCHFPNKTGKNAKNS